MASSSGARAEWDAVAYDRLSDPQVAWGQRVLARLALVGDETVLDAGCGSGRLTELLLERLPRGRVIAVDKSPAMLAEAERNLAGFGTRVSFVCSDLTALELDAAIDVVVSTATFHWILDHDALFRALYRALRPHGRLEAQCGGGPNLAWLRERVATVAGEPRFAPYFADWYGPWLFATPDDVSECLRRAGFVAVAANLEPAPTTFASLAEFREFVAKVILWPHLARLEEPLRDAFLEAVTAEDGTERPPLLDYWRLNLRGRKPA